MVGDLSCEPLVAELSDFISQLQSGIPNLCGKQPIDPGKQVFVGNKERPLTIEWKWCRPTLRAFLQQVARECPSVPIAPEQHSELDLNGIWHGFRKKPNSEQRRLLAQAIRLGFGSKMRAVAKPIQVHAVTGGRGVSGGDSAGRSRDRILK